MQTNPQNLQEQVNQTNQKLQTLQQALEKVLLGKESLIRDLLTGVLAGGHILLEGLPGLGKTELVKGFAKLCEIDFRRIQFTPDLLPSDVTGSFILQQKQENPHFLFQKGPIFTNVLLADEINRASPKTQSALLEAMAEKSVTVLGETHILEKPFFVLATQNPIELEGTYPLPEAQLDRFLFKLYLDRPEPGLLSRIVRERVQGFPPEQPPVVTADFLRECLDLAQEIYVAEPVGDYISRLVEASHPDSPLAPDLVRKYVRYGASPRAAIALGGAARARALLLAKPQAGFDAIEQLYFPVMNHRVILDYSARVDGVSISQVLNQVLQTIQPGRDIPAGVQA